MNDKKWISRLREGNQRLKKENAKLRRDLLKACKGKERVEREFEEYKKRHPKTVGVKHGKPYAIKSSTKSSKPKKQGAKKGHKPSFRKTPNHIDETRSFPVETCPLCHGTDLSEVQEERTRIIEDIPICVPIVTCCSIERRYCRTCKKLVEEPVTLALPHARLGLRTMLMVVYLKIGLRLPVASVQTLLSDVFGLQISQGEVCLVLEQMAKVFGPYYQQLQGEMREAAARHMDETSWRINGVKNWLWVFVTKWMALYKIAASRSHEVPLEVLGTNPKGVDIHDRFSAYRALAKKTGNRPQQDCWSHILGDSKELAQFNGDEGKHIHQVLKKIYAKANEFNHKGTDEDIENLVQEMALDLGRFYKSHHCYKFVENLLKIKENLFHFVKNPEVEGTNNRAERALRPHVIARKISGGSKSPKGAKIYETLISVHYTLHIRKQNLLAHGPTILSTSHG